MTTQTVAALSLPSWGHSCALLTSGELKCWGRNTQGDLGVGDNTDKTLPTTVDFGGVSVALVHTGGFHTCAHLTDGTTTCSGQNSYGQLGDGTTTHRNTPTPVQF